jgi:hypothetical protein
VSKIRRFEFDHETQDPLKYALRDDLERDVFHVNRVTNMRGELNGSKKQLFFEVILKGYEAPTWKPWSTLRRTTALHEYLRNHVDPGIRRLLPKGFERAERAAELSSDEDNSGSDASN